MRKTKRILAVMLAIVMVVGIQSLTVFADGEENVVEESSLNVENKEIEERIEKVEGAFADKGEAVSEDEVIGTEIVDGENADFVDNGVEAYMELDEAGTYVEEDVPKSGTCGDNLTWTLSDDGVLTISGSGTMRNYTREKNGIDVDFPAPQWVRSVIIEDGVTSIGDYALANIINMDPEWNQGVTIPDSVTRIGEGAFWGCHALVEIEIPDSVSYIGEIAFDFCDSLERVKLSNNITTIKNGTFFLCQLVEIEIPSSVVEIEDGAFVQSGLEKVVLPEGLKSIGNYAFKWCNLKEVTISRGVSKIGYEAFQECPLDSIRFEGDAPEFAVGGEDELGAFWGVTADVYYPENNSTWTADKMQNYGGNLTWHPWNLFIVEEATDSVYVKGSSNGATIKCTEELGKFISVAVDGVIVDSSNYTVVEGSTVLTFLSSYLDTLFVGDHVVTLNYTYGSVDTSLTVLEVEDGTNLNTPANGTNTSGNTGNVNGGSDTGKNGSAQGGVPKTGDNTSMMLWLFAVLAAGSGCVVLPYMKRKVN